MDYLEHKCKQGERWDTLALAYYEDATRVEPLFKANPENLDKLVFDGGEILKIPVIKKSDFQAANLPPWKRKQQ